MDMLCVTSVDTAGKLCLNGARLLRKTIDVNGVHVWFFDANNIPIDIGDAVQRGEAFFSNTMSIAF